MPPESAWRCCENIHLGGRKACLVCLQYSPAVLKPQCTAGTRKLSTSPGTVGPNTKQLSPSAAARLNCRGKQRGLSAGLDQI